MTILLIAGLSSKGWFDVKAAIKEVVGTSSAEKIEIWPSLIIEHTILIISLFDSGDVCIQLPVSHSL